MSSTYNEIFITGFEQQASVGIYDHEKKATQKVILSLCIGYMNERRFDQDDIKNTINYESIIQIIKDAIAERHYNLIETLAETIADYVMGINGTSSVMVEIKKPSVMGHEKEGILGIHIKRTKPQ